MTYVEILDALERAKEGFARSHFVEAVRLEAIALNPHQRYPNKHAATQAQAFYELDIADYLMRPRALEPEDVLQYRRRATAWAIAEVLRKHGRGAARGK